MTALKAIACIAVVAIAVIGGLTWLYVDTNDKRWDR
ncbi:hypothetical protein GA0070563_112175 [Micromonospora carbonacea]|uniref:Uncharacterized protein n=1 Tax=Micromonospora carbonacea TaxID=47853 RepID=A0A1C5ACQ2_9ACTN|nr:hypothetical protein GA0070563_112175 [Micromonospora carbonacea]